MQLSSMGIPLLTKRHAKVWNIPHMASEPLSLEIFGTHMIMYAGCGHIYIYTYICRSCIICMFICVCTVYRYICMYTYAFTYNIHMYIYTHNIYIYIHKRMSQ